MSVLMERICSSEYSTIGYVNTSQSMIKKRINHNHCHIFTWSEIRYIIIRESIFSN